MSWYGEPDAGSSYDRRYQGETYVPLDDMMTTSMPVYDYGECPACGHNGPHAASSVTDDGRAVELICCDCYKIFDAP